MPEKLPSPQGFVKLFKQFDCTPSPNRLLGEGTACALGILARKYKLTDLQDTVIYAYLQALYDNNDLICLAEGFDHGMDEPAYVPEPEDHKLYKKGVRIARAVQQAQKEHVLV